VAVDFCVMEHETLLHLMLIVSITELIPVCVEVILNLLSSDIIAVISLPVDFCVTRHRCIWY